MSLNEGCEWDEDPRLWLCGSCAIIALDAANAENVKLRKALKRVMAVSLGKAFTIAKEALASTATGGKKD